MNMCEVILIDISVGGLILVSHANNLRGEVFSVSFLQLCFRGKNAEKNSELVSTLIEEAGKSRRTLEQEEAAKMAIENN